MNTDDLEYDNMLDLLAFNCNQLSIDLNEYNSIAEEQNKILFEYLKKADGLHKSINDFKEDLDWFNVTEPLTTKDSLQGKIVILDFFTYCCINCMHVLPDLKKIEQLYSVEDGLVVIGVHSAKFDNEKDSANILSAVQRYDISHPVVNDGNSSMWMDLKVKCWPTMIILGPRANPLFVIMGEGKYDTLEKYIGAAFKYYKKKGELKSHSLPLNPSTDLIMSSNLKFPGKIVCSKPNATNEFYGISDSGNHRILITTSTGEVIHKIGGKTCGFLDGDFKTARFNSPQGLTFMNDNVVFVADTENHAIRKIDLKLKMVYTVAGTGYQGNDRIGGQIGIAQELSSPWDVTIYRTRDMDMSFHIDENSIPEKNILLIAIAGIHQIWALFLEDVIWWKFKKYPAGTVVAIAGNGKEENRNNSYPQNAAFAQPSGLAVVQDKKELYIADSESSCVRKLLLGDGKVLAVAGGDRNPLNLFAYGDLDGKQITAKLQHPLGVAYNTKENIIYVADTYNHKIKQIDLITSECVTCDLNYESSNYMQISEPGGLCVNPAGDKLYVADTNNHRIEIISLSNMKTKEMKITFNPSNNGTSNNYKSVKLEVNKIPLTGGKLKFSFLPTVKTTSEIKFTVDAPQKWIVNVPNDEWEILSDQSNGQVIENETIVFYIKAPACLTSKVNEYVTLIFKLNLCARDICFPKTFKIIIPLLYDKEGVDNFIMGTKVVISEDHVELESQGMDERFI